MDSQRIDPLLSPFLEATEEAEGEPLMRLFAEHLNPVIKRALFHKLRPHERRTERLGGQDMEEIHHEVQLNLLKRLRAMKADPNTQFVTDLLSYATTATLNACDEHLRRRYPLRRGLKDKLRYHIVSDPGLALWEDARTGVVAGLAIWGAEQRERISTLTPQAVRELLGRDTGLFQQPDPQRVRLSELIRAIFFAVGEPVGFSDLVSIVADLQHIHDHLAESIDEVSERVPGRLVSQLTDPESLAEQHQTIQRLWGEICLLPRRHRVALLFNLRSDSGVNIITLLPLTGVATFEQIADSVEIPAHEFEAIWANLPMDDLSIATYLGATRQQVINLRKNARSRLHKLLQSLEAGSRL